MAAKLEQRPLRPEYCMRKNSWQWEKGRRSLQGTNNHSLLRLKKDIISKRQQEASNVLFTLRQVLESTGFGGTMPW